MKIGDTVYYRELTVRSREKVVSGKVIACDDATVVLHVEGWDIRDDSPSPVIFRDRSEVYETQEKAERPWDD